MQHFKSRRVWTGKNPTAAASALGLIEKNKSLDIKYANRNYLSWLPFHYTAAGMADPLHGAWPERPDAGLLLQRGVERAGITQHSPGAADQRQELGGGAVLLSAQQQLHHTCSCGAKPSPTHGGNKCTSFFIGFSKSLVCKILSHVGLKKKQMNVQVFVLFPKTLVYSLLWCRISSNYKIPCNQLQVDSLLIWWSMYICIYNFI